MTTKLDDLVGYLAGKESDPRLQDELDDPASEVNLFLEATRSRSRALIEEPKAARSRSNRDLFRFLTRIVIGACLILALMAVGIAYRTLESRLNQIEADSRKAAVEARESAARLEQYLSKKLETKPDLSAMEPISQTLIRIESNLQRLEKSTENPKPDRMLAQIRDDLANLVFELSASDKAKARKIEELQDSVHEVSRVLKLLLKRLDPPTAPTSPESPRAFSPTGPSGSAGSLAAIVSP